jgi:cytochrome c5
MHYFIISLFFLSIHAAHASLDTDREEIQERIKPIGIVHVENTPSDTKPIPAKKAAATASAPGQEIYEHHCVVCHKDGVAGAPKFQDETTWKPRMAAADINALVASAIKGKNAMPPKGTCQECSDSDIKAAIEYMLPKK